MAARGRFGPKRAGKRTAKRKYEPTVRKKGAERRRRLEKGFWIFELGQLPLREAEENVARSPRGHRRAQRPAQGRAVRRMPSGRGLSGEQIFVTGKKPTAPGELSGGRAKPSRAPRIRRHPKRRHRNREK